jgi:hypothetical protein
MTIYLYVKTHNKTGMKYLGKTTKPDPHKYPGSGKRWIRHLKKHGYDYTTTILLTTEDKEELKETGLYFSKVWNIVESNEWANMMPEKGDGVDPDQASKENQRRVKEGTHHWQGDGERQKKLQNKLVRERTHHFLGGDLQRKTNKEKVEKGTHNFFFIDRSHVLKNNMKQVEEGTHHFLGPDMNKRMLEEGKHTSQNPDAIQKIKDKINAKVKDGSHWWVGNAVCVSEDGSTYSISVKDYENNKDLHKHMNSKEGRKRLGLNPKSSSWNAGKTIEKKIKCPHCNTLGANMGNMKRWHFDNCKSFNNHQLISVKNS